MKDGFVSVTLLYSDFYQHHSTETKVGFYKADYHKPDSLNDCFFNLDLTISFPS